MRNVHSSIQPAAAILCLPVRVFIPGRMPFPVRKFLRWKPRGTDDIVVQVSRSIVKYSNSDLSLQIMASK